MKILIGSCIRQKPAILREFLKSLDNLKKTFEYSYFFVVNNNGAESEQILKVWAQGKPVTIVQMPTKEEYIIKEDTHIWTIPLIDHMVLMRNRILNEAIRQKVNYLFMSDSDLCYHPETLERLISRNKDILSEIHWTKWHLNEPPLPNVWSFDHYSFDEHLLGKLKTNELVEVGGLCGNVLISKKALEAGVSYARIENLAPKWGEDRFFSVRAKILGLKLWVDTVKPALHLYRESDLLKEVSQTTKTEEEKPSVVIAIPHTGKIKAELANVLVQMVQRTKDIPLKIFFNYGMPVDSNRNFIVKEFLKTEYKWLLFIDSDIVPPLNVLNLLKHGKKIVGAVCYTQSPEGLPYPVIMRRAEDKKGFNVDRRVKPLMKVDATGASCLLIHREVLEKIPSPFRLGYNQDGIVDVVGEDFDFCLKAKKHGYDVWVDTTLQCSHFKEIDLFMYNKILEKEAKRWQTI